MKKLNTFEDYREKWDLQRYSKEKRQKRHTFYREAVLLGFIIFVLLVASLLTL